MKRILFIIMMAMACVSMSAQNASSSTKFTSLFEKFEDAKNVESVYISKAMFDLIGSCIGSKLVGVKSMEDFLIRDKLSKIDHLYILSSKDTKMAAGLADIFSSYYKEGKFEELMRMKDNGQKTTIYMQQMKNKMSEFGLFSTGDGETRIISIVGTLTINDIKDVVGKDAKGRAGGK